MPWGPIVFAAIALAFVVLVLIAIKRMRAGKRGGSLAESPESEAEEGTAAGELEETEEDEASAEDQDTADTEAPARPHGKKAVVAEMSRTLPDSPHAKIDAAGAERERLAAGLAKTRGGFIARLGALFKGKAELDPGLVEQIEEILFSADIGVATTGRLMEGLRSELSKKELQRPEAVWAHVKQRSAEIMAAAVAAPLDLDRARPFVILVVGVNGTGKTTTIGKLAARLRQEGRSLVLAAGDTFRAAAAEQLEIWGERTASPVIKGKEGADPSSVIVDALKHAKEQNTQVVIADTAGRLHTKVDLMQEIQKVRRSIGKHVPGAPHETFLVLDATTGQNAIAQAKMFKEALDITGIILTKLDGTAKGGVVLGICHELKVPVRFIGIGERAEDLRAFDPEAFVDALYQGAGEDA